MAKDLLKPLKVNSSLRIKRLKTCAAARVTHITVPTWRRPTFLTNIDFLTWKAFAKRVDARCWNALFTRFSLSFLTKPTLLIAELDKETKFSRVFANASKDCAESYSRFTLRTVNKSCLNRSRTVFSAKAVTLTMRYTFNVNKVFVVTGEACHPYEPFKCPGDGACISIQYLCDGAPDCPDGWANSFIVICCVTSMSGCRRFHRPIGSRSINCAVDRSLRFAALLPQNHQSRISFPVTILAGR